MHSGDEISHFRSVAAIVLLLFAATLAAGIEVPSRERVLHIARLEDPRTLDPALIEMQEDFLLFPLVHMSLLEITNGTTLVPQAAKSWNVSADQKCFTFQLREGVRFGDCREVVAEDFVFSLERILDPVTGSMMSSYLQGILGVKEFLDKRAAHIVGIQAPDRHTLTITLERSDPTFAYLMASQVGVAVPREVVLKNPDNYAVKPEATGPYKVRKWVRGAYLTLEQNRNYCGPVQPYFDRIEILIGADETTRMMMFERGELDIAGLDGYGIPFSSLYRVTRDDRWRGLVEHQPAFGVDYVSMNCEMPPLDNKKVRQAINYAVNRDRWMRVQQGLFIHGKGVIPPNMPGFNEKLVGYPYDPGKARQLLAESGLSLPLRIELWHPLLEATRFRAQGIQEDLRQVGIEVSLNPVDAGIAFTAAQQRKRVPMFMTGWNVAIPDPVDILASLLDGRAAMNTPTLNLAFFQNPVVDHLFDEALKETDIVRRLSLYREAEEMVVEGAPWIFLGHQNIYALRQPWIKGPLLEPIYWYRLDRIWREF
jgi:ABC-type transport system substrate-binding protein